MVVAALITTLGAITAACIQTGIGSKSPTANVGDFSPSPASPPWNAASASSTLTARPEERVSMASSVRNLYASPADDVYRAKPRIASASFVGTIEPLNEGQPENRPMVVPTSNYQPIEPQRTPESRTYKPAPQQSFTPSAEANTAAFLQTAAVQETKLTVGYPPALLPDAAPAKILPSPWSFLAEPTASDKAPEAIKAASSDKPVKAAKKSLDWGSVARIWPWHS
jgi:hypothetical protein